MTNMNIYNCYVIQGKRLEIIFVQRTTWHLPAHVRVNNDDYLQIIFAPFNFSVKVVVQRSKLVRTFFDATFEMFESLLFELDFCLDLR